MKKWVLSMPWTSLTDWVGGRYLKHLNVCQTRCSMSSPHFRWFSLSKDWWASVKVSKSFWYQYFKGSWKAMMAQLNNGAPLLENWATESARRIFPSAIFYFCSISLETGSCRRRLTRQILHILCFKSCISFVQKGSSGSGKDSAVQVNFEMHLSYIIILGMETDIFIWELQAAEIRSFQSKLEVLYWARISVSVWKKKNKAVYE